MTDMSRVNVAGSYEAASCRHLELQGVQEGGGGGRVRLLVGGYWSCQLTVILTEIYVRHTFKQDWVQLQKYYQLL